METKINEKQLCIIMIGLMMAMLMASLDSTIVGTAMKSITEELNGIDSYTLPVTAYLVCSTIATPIFGKLSDIIGRKTVYLSGIAIFFVGSILCGLSQNMIQLICFRGLQGIGGGIIVSSTYSMVGEMVTPKERGKYMGMIASTYGISSVIGPLIGGIITDNLGWRWVFCINVPLAFIATVMTFRNLPNVKRQVKGQIDYLGIITFIIMLAPLLVVLNLGGSTYDWLSFQVISMIAVSLISMVLFILTEKKSKQPMIDISLFKNSVFSISSLLSFLSYMVLVGIVVFIPLYVQGALGNTATSSGIFIVPMTLAMTLSSIISGRLISKTGKYKFQGIVGFLIIIFGLLILNFMKIGTSKIYLVISMILIGCGLGTTFPIFNVAVQNQFSLKQIGMVTSGIQFFRNMGSSIGTAIFGCIFGITLKNDINNFAWAGIPDKIKNLINNKQTMSNTRAISQIVGDLANNKTNFIDRLLSVVRNMLYNTIHSVFFAVLVISLICFIASIFLKEYPVVGYKREKLEEKFEMENENIKK